MSLVLDAVNFAILAHGAQVRKYNGEPYVTHLIAVAKTVSNVSDDPMLVAAAILHDVLEDTRVTEKQLREKFPERVVNLVVEVTDVSKPHDGNRRIRKAMDRDHLAKASPCAQTIKYADILDNTSNILQNDPKFAELYIQEKRELLRVMTKGDVVLRDKAIKQIGGI